MRQRSDRTCARMINFVSEAISKEDWGKAYSINHFIRVFAHTRSALNVSSIPKEEWKRRAVLYAAILYDVDDQHSIDRENARFILDSVVPGEEELHSLVLEMIHKRIECEDAKDWTYIPMLCNMLDDIGEEGVLRAWLKFNHEKGEMFTSSTPRAINEDQIEEEASPLRRMNFLERYESESMIDYFYDHLLHIKSGTIPNFNTYITGQLVEKREYLVKFLLIFGKRSRISEDYYKKLMTLYL